MATLNGEVKVEFWHSLQKTSRFREKATLELMRDGPPPPLIIEPQPLTIIFKSFITLTNFKRGDYCGWVRSILMLLVFEVELSSRPMQFFRSLTDSSCCQSEATSYYYMHKHKPINSIM